MSDIKSDKLTELLAFSIGCLTYSVICLLLKRDLANDFFVIDQNGFKLPRFIGSGRRFQQYTPWSSVTHVSAGIAEDNIKNSKLFVAKNNGRNIAVALNQFEPEFVEQLLLSAKMWASSQCDASVDELQNRLRANKSGILLPGATSFTEIWEDELGRRFNPISYIPLESGRVLHQNLLRIVRQLASGGLSALYLCQQNDRELVVLKESVIPEHIEPDVKAKASELFDREAKILMKLDHPNVVKVLDTFVEAERNYLVLEYANGADLRLLVRQNGVQSEADVLDWAIQIASTLRYLHEREVPIIHRDLTPDNIVLKNDGQIVIVDFGAANEFIGNATGTFVGKHAYIAPEQLRGKATTQSDIYAFGGTLYFLLTGVEPEALSSSRPKDKVASISDELSEFVETCTQLETTERYKSVAQLLPVLKRLSAQSMVV
ncbi:MAG: serine/threonine-protein kinase [Candidatus Obscuribacterales bacterium]|nr:serine/threonine-protein kinase [Candidatus Obscuribacterales bacterium]